MRCKAKVFTVVLAGLFALVLCGCNRNKNAPGNGGGTGDDAPHVGFVQSEMFTERDLAGGYASGYRAGEEIVVTLADGASTCASNAVRISDDVITVTASGVYKISGTLTDGRIVVEAPKTEKVQLILSGVNVNCDTSAALYVKSADKVFVTLAKNTANSFSNKDAFVAVGANNIDGVVFGKDDITIGGSGSLAVNAAYGHGIVCKNDLKITGGLITVTAPKHALEAKDSVRIAAGTLALTGGTDGIHAENTEETEEGYVYIVGGVLDITATTDAIDADMQLQIDGGKISLDAGTNGLKCTGDIIVNGGELEIAAQEDGVHSDGNIEYKGAETTVSCLDDAFHADASLSIRGGTVEVTESHEGLEAVTVNLSGGTIRIKADDDGINVMGGVDGSGLGGMDGGMWGSDGMRPRAAASARLANINISGGTIYVDALGDGIDSNGNITVSGGETYVSGSVSSTDSALDYDGVAKITGGIFVACGMNGMAQNFSTATQGSILYASGTGVKSEVVLKDASDKVLIRYTPAKTYNAVVVSCPAITKGSAYTLAACGRTENITMDTLLYGNRASMGGDPKKLHFQARTKALEQICLRAFNYIFRTLN